MVSDGGLGSHLVGDKIVISQKTLHVTKLLGEGKCHYGFQWHMMMVVRPASVRVVCGDWDC